MIRGAREQPQGSEQPRPTLSTKGRASFKASMFPQSQDTALTILPAPTWGECVRSPCPGPLLGPSQPCWGAEDSQGGSVVWPPRVGEAQQRHESQVERRQTGRPRLTSRSASGPPVQPPTPDSADPRGPACLP